MLFANALGARARAIARQKRKGADAGREHVGSDTAIKSKGEKDSYSTAAALPSPSLKSLSSRRCV